MILLLVFTLFIVAVSNKANKDETLDLNLETTLLFDPKDSSRDLMLISKFRSFLDTLEAIIDRQARQKSGKKHKNKKSILRNKNEKARNESGSKKDDRRIFTKFLEGLGSVLLTYKADEFANVTKILEHEFNNIVNLPNFRMDVVYQRLRYDPNIKAFITNKIHEWTLQDPEYLQTIIKNSLKNTKNDTLTIFVKKLNTLYDEKDEKIFKKITKILSLYPKKRMDISPVIFKALKYILFERNNDTDKNLLLKDIKELGVYIKSKNPLDSHVEYRRNLINKIFPSLRKSEEDLSNNIDGVVLNTNNSLEKITQDTEEAENLPNEIVINKDVEINVVNEETTVKTSNVDRSTVSKQPKTTDKPKTTKPIENDTKQIESEKNGENTFLIGSAP